MSDPPRESRERLGRRSYRRLWPLPIVPLVLVAIIVTSALTGWHHHGGSGFCG